MLKKFNDRISEEAMNRNVNSMLGITDNYIKWNLGLFPIEFNKNILDLGCGSGMYFDEIIKRKPSLYVGADYSQSYIRQMNSLFNGRSNCKAIQLDIMDTENAGLLKGYKFDYVFLFDVLEHLEDDNKALTNIYNLMKSCKANLLFLRVPAIQAIYGRNDAAIGHYRRYSTRTLRKVIEQAYFRIHLIHYQNLLGFFSWFVIGKVLKRELAVSTTEGKIFNLLVPAIKAMEKYVRPPLGSSLYCICGITK